MGIKKQLGMGLTTAVLGLTLIGGGTFAYFSDTEETTSAFAAGTLDLTAEPTEVINVDNMVPGDSIIRDFELQNNGTVDIDTVYLETDYTYSDTEGDDFGEHIEVEFLYNADHLNEVIYQTTLAELQDMTPEAINEHIFYPAIGEKGLPAGESHDFIVQINFLDNGDQNHLQGASLNLEWTFVATQGDGQDI